MGEKPAVSSAEEFPLLYEKKPQKVRVSHFSLMLWYLVETLGITVALLLPC